MNTSTSRALTPDQRYVATIDAALARGWDMGETDRVDLSRTLLEGSVRGELWFAHPDDREWLRGQYLRALAYLDTLAPDGYVYIMTNGQLELIEEQPGPILVVGSADYRRPRQHRDLDGDCTIIGCEICI